jgi:hypothetical protein
LTLICTSSGSRADGRLTLRIFAIVGGGFDIEVVEVVEVAVGVELTETVQREAFLGCSSSSGALNGRAALFRASRLPALDCGRRSPFVAELGNEPICCPRPRGLLSRAETPFGPLASLLAVLKGLASLIRASGAPALRGGRRSRLVGLRTARDRCRCGRSRRTPCRRSARAGS